MKKVLIFIIIALLCVNATGCFSYVTGKFKSYITGEDHDEPIARFRVEIYD